MSHQTNPTRTARERMDELKERAGVISKAGGPSDKEREDEIERFDEEEIARFQFQAPGMPGLEIEAIMHDIALNAPSFRLSPRPSNAWELVRGYSEALGSRGDLCKYVYGSPEEAFDAGFLIGTALARHESGHPGRHAAPEWQRDSDASATPDVEQKWTAVMKAED